MSPLVFKDVLFTIPEKICLAESNLCALLTCFLIWGSEEVEIYSEEEFEIYF